MFETTIIFFATLLTIVKCPDVEDHNGAIRMEDNYDWRTRAH